MKELKVNCALSAFKKEMETSKYEDKIDHSHLQTHKNCSKNIYWMRQQINV